MMIATIILSLSGLIIFAFGILLFSEKKVGGGIFVIIGLTLLFDSFMSFHHYVIGKNKEENVELFQQTCKDYFNNKVEYIIEGYYQDSTFIATDTVFFYKPQE